MREQDECVDPDGHNEKRSKGAGGSSTGCSKQEKFQHRSRRSGKNLKPRKKKPCRWTACYKKNSKTGCWEMRRQSQLQKLAEDLWQELWQRCPGQFSTCNHAPSLLPWRCWCLQPGAGQWWHHRGQPRRKSDVQVWYLRSGRAKESDQRINTWVKTCLLAETKKLKPIRAYCHIGCCWHKHKSKHTQVDDINNLG